MSHQHQQQYRPTPYSIALATLICLHTISSSSSLSSSSSESNDNKNDEDDDIQFMLFYKKNQNTTSNTSSSMYQTAMDTFIQQQLMNYHTTITNNNDGNDISSSSSSTSSLLLHGPTINHFIQQLHHSLVSFVVSRSLSVSISTSPTSEQQQHIEEISSHNNIHEQILQPYIIWLQLMIQSIDTFIDLFHNIIHRCIVLHDTNNSSNDATTTTTTNTNNNTTTMIDRTSMNGIYIRSILFGYENLSFIEITQLYTSFYNQIIHTITLPLSLNTTTNSTTTTTNNNNNNDLSSSKSESEKSKDWIVSSEQIDKTIREWCYTGNYNNNNTNTNTYHDDDITKIQDYYPFLSSIHFLNYKSYLLENHERVQTNHTLYEFIDTTFIQSYHNHNNINTNTDILQYASILQAMIHCNFNEISHMVHAIDEAIRVTQQQQQQSSSTTTTSTTTNNTTATSSTATLFALTWSAIVQPYRRNHLQQNKEQIILLQHCMNYCKNLLLGNNNNNSTTTSTNNSKVVSTNASNVSLSLIMGIHLLYAKITNSWMSYDQSITFHMINSNRNTNNNNNSTINPNRINPTTTTTRSNTTTTTNQSSSLLKNQYDRPIHVLHLDNPYILYNVLVRQKFIATSIYYTYYNECTLSLTTIIEILLYYYYNENNEINNNSTKSTTSPSNDILFYSIRNLAIIGSTIGSTRIGNEFIQTLINTTARTTNDNRTLIHNTYTKYDCIYAKAIYTYITLCDLYHISFTQHENKLLYIDLILLLHEWSIRRHELHHSNTLKTILLNYMSDPTICCQMYVEENHICNNIIDQFILSHIHQGQYELAKEILNQNIIQSKQRGQYYRLARSLLQLSKLYIDMDEQQQQQHQQQFMNALQPLFECLSLSKQHKMDGIYHEGLLLLAHIHFYLGQYHQSSTIIQMIIPTLHRSCHVIVQADAYLLLSQCHMKQCSNNTNHNNNNTNKSSLKRQYRLLLLSEQELHRSRLLYETCHDYQKLQKVHYLLSHIYQHLSMISSNKDNIVTKHTKGKHDDHETNNHDHYKQLRNKECTNYMKYTKRLSLSSPTTETTTTTKTTTSTGISIANLMNALTTRDGILSLINRSI